MTQVVDARGLACPQPVILTRRALQDNDAVITIVDDETARRNVTRMAEKAGYSVEVEQREDGTYLYIGDRCALAEEEPSGAAVAPIGGPLVLVVSSEFMGRGEHDELGRVLIRGFFHTLGEVEPVPNTIVFLNSGVKLVVEGSPVLQDVEALSERGIEILACGTCLGYYGLTEKLVVGQISNMYSIAEIMLGAGRVIHL